MRFNLEERLWKGGRGSHASIALGIWLHRDDKLFNGRAASIDGVTYSAEDLVAAWSSRPGVIGGLM